MTVSPSWRFIHGRLIIPLGVFLLYGALAVIHSTEKPGLPGDYISPAGEIKITAIDGIGVSSADDVEFYLSGYRIGDTVEVEVGGRAAGRLETAVLISYYPGWYILFDIVAAAVILGFGVVVRLHLADRGVGAVFFLASGTLTMALLGTKTIHAIDPPWLGNALCFIFFLAYSLIPVLFLHFSAIFPQRRHTNLRPALMILYLAGTALAVWQSLAYLDAAGTGSMALFDRFGSNTVWMNGFMIAGIATGLTVMVGSYRRADSLGDRRKIAWILYGLFIGTAPFVLFWVLPQTIDLQPLIPEVAFKIFLLVIPASFSIAILKYRLLDITIIINRSFFHAIVIGALLAIYALLIGATVEFISTWTVGSSIFVSAVAAILAAVAYDPVRKWAQSIVDRSFFRIGYDFRGSLKQLLEELEQASEIGEMARRLVAGIDRLMPVERIGYFVLTRPGNRLLSMAQRNFEGLDTHVVRFELDKQESGLDLPVALDEKIEPSVKHEKADSEVFRKWGISLVLPMKSKRGEIFGFLVLGEKKSGLGFSEEDVDLLAVLTTRVAIENERLSLQRSLLIEQAESERLEEISRMKSFFVSSVSHDLKTPLTSIRMFAELLRSKDDVDPETAAEYLKIIEGESERLTRLINNVLDFAKIERGAKEYQLRETDLNALVEKVCAIMEYQFRIEKADVRVALSEGALLINADPDAILEALLNIISNALKYSPGEKVIELETSRRDGGACVMVRDSGVGIPAAEMKNIFDPFYRVKGKGDRDQGAGGTGLGLAVVKHIVDAHDGTIDVDSEVGTGSRFAITFRGI